MVSMKLIHHYLSVNLINIMNVKIVLFRIMTIEFCGGGEN